MTTCITAAPAANAIDRKHAWNLVRYLINGNGKDMTEFTDGTGAPDLAAARAFAETLRQQHRDFLGRMLTIEQVNHRVTITAILPSFA